MSVVDLTTEINGIASFPEQKSFKLEPHHWVENSVSIVPNDNCVNVGKIKAKCYQYVTYRKIEIISEYHSRECNYPLTEQDIKTIVYDYMRSTLYSQLEKTGFKRPRQSALYRWFEDAGYEMHDKLAALWKYYFLRNDTKAEHVVQALELMMRKSNAKANSNK